MTTPSSRYVGARPFETEHRPIFFGRKGDVNALFKRVELEPVVVLHGKSGTGKSSLINAGLIPRIEQESGANLTPLRIRFYAYQEGADFISPAKRTGQLIRGGTKSVHTFLDQLIENEQSIWHDTKEHFIIHKGQKGLLLIFDQFEELFTYPQALIEEFQQQLAEALYRSAPQRYWDAMEQLYSQGTKALSSEEQSLLQGKPFVKVIFSIRSDRFHLLNRLDNYLPTVLKYPYELSALSLDSAREAIIGPASLPQKLGGEDNPNGPEFISGPFFYSEDALEHILDFLTYDQQADKAKTLDPGAKPEKQQHIEGTQLQIICSSIEQRVIQKDLFQVEVEDLGNLQEIIANYYHEKVESLEAHEYMPVRRLIEEGLIFEESEGHGIRLSLFEGQILQTYGISSDTLRKLVNSHLLRAEPRMTGGYTYELSHDTLIQPVLEAKTRRLKREALEAKERERQRQALEMARLKEEAEAEKRRAEEAEALRKKAEEARVEAVREKERADEARREADKKRRRANILTLIALLSMVYNIWAAYDANKARQAAEISLQQVKQEKAAKDLLRYLDFVDRGKTLMNLEYYPSARKLFIQADSLVKEHEEMEVFAGKRQELDEEMDRLTQLQKEKQ